MPEWPSPDQQSVYVPPMLAPEQPPEAEIRARIAGARIREGLSVSDEILSQILAEDPGSGSGGPGMFTAAEQQDIYGDNERVARAGAVLAGADDVLGGLQVCWRGLRGVRVLLTGEHDRYRRMLSDVIDPDRLVIDSAAFTERELRRRGGQVRAQTDELAEQGIFLAQHGIGLDG
jgi:hypothetical protein